MEALGSLPVRRSIQTPSGRISYTEEGKDPVALFVHGVLLNGHLWRHQQIVAPLDPAQGTRHPG